MSAFNKPMYGVYRVLKNGGHKYVSRSVTENKRLAESIADDLSHGQVVSPTGRIIKIPAHPHIVKAIGSEG